MGDDISKITNDQLIVENPDFNSPTFVENSPSNSPSFVKIPSSSVPPRLHLQTVLAISHLLSPTNTYSSFFHYKDEEQGKMIQKRINEEAKGEYRGSRWKAEKTSLRRYVNLIPNNSQKSDKRLTFRQQPTLDIYICIVIQKKVVFLHFQKCTYNIIIT